MMKMKTHVFLITAKTNLHVGNESGGEFSVIDKSIQRDPLTKLPCINSSSLKGAIKEFCVHDGMDGALVKSLFGSEVDKNGKAKEDTQKGEAVFFDAKLLYLPQQDDNTLFHYATCQDAIDLMNERVSLFGEKFDYQIPKEIGNKQTKLLLSAEFYSVCGDDSLPIIARNVLENGESKNLWYEQVLPAETILYTIIQEKNDDLANALDGKIVQIGAGATIGYGYCQFKLINKKETKK